MQKEKADEQSHCEEDDRDERSMGSYSNLSNSCASPQDSLDSVDYKARHLAPSISLMMQTGKFSDLSSFHSESLHLKADEFFDDQIILERRAEKKDLLFRKGCLHPEFINHISAVIDQFMVSPSDFSFACMLEQLFQPCVPIFTQEAESEGEYPIAQALEDMFYRNMNTYLVYTFDWSLCHLSFTCLLLIYWVQIDFFQLPEESVQIQSSPKSTRKRGCQTRHQQNKMRQNLSQIAQMYAEQRSREINTNQIILLIIYYFINLLKREPLLEIVGLSNTQNKLMNDIQLFRRIKRKEHQFYSSINQVIFQSQLRKYEHENKLISSVDKNYELLHLINSHNFVSTPLSRYYQIGPHANTRKEYQNKRDCFCIWVLEIINRLCDRKSAESLSKSAMYVIHFMGILKKMREDTDLEGIAIIVPILANLKLMLPKVWDFALKRRPSIEQKFVDHSEYLLRKLFKVEDLGSQGAILWNETLYDITEQMSKHVTRQKVVIEQHKQFYENFLQNFLNYRRKIQQQYQQEIDYYNRDREIGSSFNMYLLDTYIPHVYKERVEQGQWQRLKQRAAQTNKSIDNSFLIDVIDYCMIGSTTRFSVIDI